MLHIVKHTEIYGILITTLQFNEITKGNKTTTKIILVDFNSIT